MEAAMRIRAKFVAASAGLAMLGAAGLGVAAVPAYAADFLGVPLWESYPGQYQRYYDPNDRYSPPPSRYNYNTDRRRYDYDDRQSPQYYYDPYTGRYYRRY
jgi:hypothetical protein